MKDIQNKLNEGFVIVAIDEKYNDNDGAFDKAIMFNPETKAFHTVVDKYTKHTIHLEYEITATDEQIEEAAEIYCTKNVNWPIDDILSGYVVTLQRSRKAPNRTPLKVLCTDKGGYNHRYNQWDDPSIKVEVEGEGVWVSTNCVKELIRAPRPWWAL